ncbi:MAG: hypothetical protein HOW73_27400 [Polyangiaceae bacterium]|nr:hypothetical protein [Polyangiaceae bacterium]
MSSPAAGRHRVRRIATTLGTEPPPGNDLGEDVLLSSVEINVKHGPEAQRVFLFGYYLTDASDAPAACRPSLMAGEAP